MHNNNHSSNINFRNRALSLKNMMIQSDVANPDLIKGCSTQEINRLEQENNVSLPTSYKIFLENFGHGLGGRIMKECDILYDDIFPLTSLLKNEILIEEGDPCLPDKAFVFSGRYNEQFMFFDASGLIEEPPIYLYMIDEKNFTKIGDSIFDIFNI